MDKRNIESIFPLTRLQQAFLFQGIGKGRNDPGQLQMHIELEGKIDKHAFSTAWQWLVQQHPVLRTSIHWKDLKEPLQVVHRQCNFDINFIDINRQDRPEISKAPVMQVMINSESTNKHTMIWRCHHILLDGWSAAILLQQVIDKYRSIISGVHAPSDPVVSYQKWTQYLASREETNSKTFWQNELDALKPDISLWQATQKSPKFKSSKISLDPEFAELILQQARKFQTTAGILMQLVWAIALAQLKQADEIVFGLSVSGRSGKFPGIESMVGLFANALPVRIALSPTKTPAMLLQELQQASKRRTNHEHVSIADLYEWGCLTGQQPFDSLLVVENFPWQDGTYQDSGLDITSFEGDISNHYPLTLAVIPSSPFQLKIFYMQSLLNDTEAIRCLELLTQIMRVLLDNPQSTMEQLLPLITKATPSLNLNMQVTRKPPPPIQGMKEPPEETKLSNALLHAWRTTLGTEEIDEHDSFFDFGGNSFLALVLLNHIKEIAGKSLPLVSIYQAPSVAEMISFVENGVNDLSGTRLMPVRREGHLTPFFMLSCYSQMAKKLAEHLDPAQPLYVLADHWEHADIGLNETLEDLAAKYIKDMRRISINGPWLIGGYSMGAVIAYEIAQQLKACGEEVKLLFMLDPPVNAQAFKNIARLQQSISFNIESESAHPFIPSQQPKPSKSIKKNPVGSGDNNVSKQAVIRSQSSILKLAKKLSYPFRIIKQKVSFRVRHFIYYPLVMIIAHQLYKRGKEVPESIRYMYVTSAYSNAMKRYKLHRYMGETIIVSNRSPADDNLWETLTNGNNRLEFFDCEHWDFSWKPEILHGWVSGLKVILEEHGD